MLSHVTAVVEQRVTLNPDPLDLVERDRVAGAVIALRGARAFVRRQALRLFACAAGVYRGRDPGCTFCRSTGS